MSRTPKWTRRADARPEELARAALELCAELGVQRTKVADVAARAGVTVGTVYRYFADKDALVEAALQLSARIPEARDAPDRPGATLPALADSLRRWGEYFRDVGAPALRVALSDPARGAAASRAGIDDAEREIGALLTHGVQRGDVRADLDPASVARALVSALLVAPALSLSAGARTHTADIDALVALATRGLRADGPSWKPTT